MGWISVWFLVVCCCCLGFVSRTFVMVCMCICCCCCCCCCCCFRFFSTDLIYTFFSSAKPPTNWVFCCYLGRYVFLLLPKDAEASRKTWFRTVVVALKGKAHENRISLVMECDRTKRCLTMSPLKAPECLEDHHFLWGDAMFFSSRIYWWIAAPLKKTHVWNSKKCWFEDDSLIFQRNIFWFHVFFSV